MSTSGQNAEPCVAVGSWNEAKIRLARGNTPAGTVGELQQKHLLALNLRSVKGSIAFAPRSYFMPSVASQKQRQLQQQQDQPTDVLDESDAFRQDFMLSHAAALLMCSVHTVPLLHGQQEEVVALACRVCRRSLGTTPENLRIEEHEWQALSALELRAEPQQDSDQETTTHLHPDIVEEAKEVLDMLHSRVPGLQLTLLHQNVWILKPSTGALGRGISFVTGLGKDGGFEVAAPSGKLLRSGQEALGYIMQKYIENPHLIDPCGLAVALEEANDCLDADPACSNGNDDDSSDAGAARTLHTPEGLYKYNVRSWVYVKWSADEPEAWFYEDGYIQFANRPYTADLRIADAHVTNLSLPSEGNQRPPWMWTTSLYRSYMDKEGGGNDVYAERLLPAFKEISARTLSSVRPCASSGRKASWKRFGIDFAVDALLSVWLIEFNYNPGMSSPKGRRGELKRELVGRYYQSEQQLRQWRQGTIEHNERLCSSGSGNSCRHAFGFVRLDIPRWNLPYA